MSVRPLSVALLSHLASPGAPTGAERSLALLAAGLGRRGHRVALVGPGRSPLEATVGEAGVESVTIPSRACWLTYYEPRPWPLVLGKWLRWRVGRGGAGRIERWLRQWNPDVVHVNCLPHLAGVDAARAAGRPVVWHLREILPPGARRRWFAERLERGADRIVAVSEAVADWVVAAGVKRPVDVVYNGIDPGATGGTKSGARRELGLGEAGTLVGLFGQLVPHKGVLDFIEAAATIVRSQPDTRFLIAGDGPAPFVDRIDRSIAATGRGDRIRRVAARSDPALLFAATDVVALTTRTPDPLPRSVLEAMAAGRPVVSYSTGGVPEMIEHGSTGLLVEVGDVAGLGRAIADLTQDRTRREEMGRRAARIARERFSVERHVDRMERLLSDAAARRSGSSRSV